MLLCVKVVEFDLTHVISVFTASIQRFKALQDTVDHKRVVLVTHGYQIAMTFRVRSLVRRAICFGNVDADWVARHTFYNFVELEVLQGEDSKISIIACCYNPVLFSVTPDSESDNVIYFAAVKS